MGALADALGVDPAWSRKLLAAYGSDLAQAASDWRQDRAQTAAKAGIELPPGAALGRPFMDATLRQALRASAVNVPSDWC